MYGLSEAMDKAFLEYYISSLDKEQAYKKIKMVADKKGVSKTILTKDQFMSIEHELKANDKSEEFGLETLGSIHYVVGNSILLIESDEFGQAVVSYTGDI